MPSIRDICVIGALVLSAIQCGPVVTGATNNTTVQANSVRSQTCFSDEYCIYFIKRDNKMLAVAQSYSSKDYTIQLDWELIENGKTSNKKIHTTLPARHRKILIKSGILLMGEYRYKWTYTSHIGTTEHTHQDIVYRLPFVSGKVVKVLQGYGGSFSHFDSQQYALDFSVPIGTTIVAARAGKVIGLRENATEVGTDAKYKSQENYIWIQHDDGTVGNYLHLDLNGVLVEEGQHVSSGEVIGKSGNTGYSTGPHLHFMVSSVVLKNNEIQPPFAFQTFPTRFETSSGHQLLEDGESYQVP